MRTVLRRGMLLMELRTPEEAEGSPPKLPIPQALTIIRRLGCFPRSFRAPTHKYLHAN